ncbi:ammonium transporter [Cryobacterium sp. BB736]|uniref:ammonium transporter n=1 Tax=Cryobacterium sp. BB736 TaxID=2746963 RepID=UPI001873E477|nr:ammonium transporter [Cryobacterium sp. BB736]
MFADSLLLVAGVVGILIATPGVLLYGGGHWRMLWPAAVTLFALWCLAGIAAALAGWQPFGFAVLVPAGGFVAGMGVAMAACERFGPSAAAGVAVAFSVLVFLPLALVVFGGGGMWLYRTAGALDFAGALPVAIGGGVFLLVLAFKDRGAPAVWHPRAVIGVALLWASSIVAGIGFELRVDELTPVIALNSVLTPAASAVAVVVVERLKSARNSGEGFAAGVLAGVAGALGTSAYLEPVSAVILGLVVGTVCGALFKPWPAAAGLGAPLLIGGLWGLLFLGVFALGPGFVYSGQPTQLASQFSVTALATVFALVLSMLIATVASLLQRGR